MTASPVKVIKGYLPFREQAPLFNALAAGPWHRALIRGKEIHRQNIVFYEGDPEAARAYTKKATDKEPPIPYADGPAELRAVRSRLQEEYGFSFSACYINVYADETVGIGWHNDAEEIGSKVPVKMLCLGGTRLFSIWRVRKDANGKLLLSEPLRDANSEPLLDAKGKPKKRTLIFAEWEEETESGDLVEMPVGFHEVAAYRHAVLPQKQYAAPRISLTFRSPDLSVTGPWAPKEQTKCEPAPIEPVAAAPRVYCCKAGRTPPADAVYMGCKTVRGQKRDGSVFGNAVNPLKVRCKSNPWAAGQGIADPKEKEKAFRAYADKKMKDDAEFRKQVEGLRGKDLLCWCEQDGPNKEPFCHARIWLEIANRPTSSPQQDLYGLASRRQSLTEEHVPTTIENEF